MVITSSSSSSALSLQSITVEFLYNFNKSNQDIGKRERITSVGENNLIGQNEDEIHFLSIIFVGAIAINLTSRKVNKVLLSLQDNILDMIFKIHIQIKA